MALDLFLPLRGTIRVYNFESGHREAGKL